MAKLTAQARNSMPARGFALPHERKYPVPDKNHAAVAKGRAKHQFNVGNLSKAQLEQVDAAADKKLGEKEADGMANGGKVMKAKPSPTPGYADGGSLRDMAPMFHMRKQGPISQD